VHLSANFLKLRTYLLSDCLDALSVRFLQFNVPLANFTADTQRLLAALLRSCTTQSLAFSGLSKVEIRSIVPYYLLEAARLIRPFTHRLALLISELALEIPDHSPVLLNVRTCLLPVLSILCTGRLTELSRLAPRRRSFFPCHSLHKLGEDNPILWRIRTGRHRRMRYKTCRHQHY
jgi:hypothetical protein